MSNDTQILRGFSNITNLENVKQGMNIEDIENQLINGGLVSKTKDPQDKFNEELKDLANQFGITFGETTPKKKPVEVSAPPPALTQTYEKEYSEYDGSSSSNNSNNSNNNNYDYDDPEPEDSSPLPSPTLSTRTFSRDVDLSDVTEEQERKSHIKSVMREIAPSHNFSFEKEKKEDEKCVMLEEIDSLLYSLTDAEVDLSRIPKVNFSSSHEEIEMVLKILRHKSDRARYCNLAEEFIIWGAYGMEELFDGKKVWLNRYQPCLTGWHTHVQTKLRRMRHDTSQIVSDVMHDYNIGPGMRVLLELVPNMFVYSNEKKKNHGQNSLYSNEELAAANERLRGL